MGYNPVRFDSKEEIRDHLAQVDPYDHNNALVLHHTWKPTEKVWDDGYKWMKIEYDYFTYVKKPNWSHLPTQFWCAPDGIFDARPFSYRNGAHALIRKSVSGMSAELQAFIRECRNKGTKTSQALNHHSMGCETVGNFDGTDPRDNPAMENSIILFAAAVEVWDIPLERIFFHREVEYKSCPGDLVTKDWFVNEVAREASTSPGQGPKDVVIVGSDGAEVVGANGKIQDDGRTYVVIAEVLDHEDMGFTWEGGSPNILRVKD